METPTSEAMESPTIGKLMAALAKAQAKMKAAALNATNPHFNAAYAGLDAIWEACREPLAENELAVVQTTREDQDGTAVLTTLGHSSGEFIRSKLYITPRERTSQAVGSAITYARRYSLAAITGVAPKGDDDDGEKSMGRDAKGKTAQAAKPPAPKLISQAEQNTLIEEAKIRGVSGRALLDQIKVHFPTAHRLGDLPASAYNACYEWIIKHEIPKTDALEVEIAQLEKIGINRDVVHAYISTLPNSSTTDMVVRNLNATRTGLKVDALRKFFADAANRAKSATAA